MSNRFLKIKCSVVFIVLFILVSIISVSCKNQTNEWTGTISEEDGVIVVKNPKEPMYGEEVFSLEEELTVGGPGKDEVEGIFALVTSIDVDDQENIYVLDTKQKKISAFNKHGEFLRTYGEVGQGPGEFSFPWMISVSPQQQLILCDFIVRKLIFYAMDGNVFREISLLHVGTLLSAKQNSSGKFIADAFSQGPREAVYSLEKFDPSLEQSLYKYGEFKREKSPVLEKISHKIKWTINKKDDIIWGFSAEYKILIHNDQGKLIMKILKDYDPQRVFEKEYEDEIKRKFGGKSIPPVFEQKLPEFHPAFQSITVDEGGKIFVLTFEKTPERNAYYCDVFSTEGKYITKIPLKTIPLWKRNKMYTIEEDEEGYQVVKRYKVNWSIK